MPIGGVQGLLNSWIKVNSKHVTRQDTDESGDVQVQRRPSSPFKNEGEQLGQASTSSYHSRDSQRPAIRKLNNRRTRKLERTVSLTDLLREMAAEKQAEQRLNTDSSKGSPSNTSGFSSQAMQATQQSAPSTNTVASIPVVNVGHQSAATWNDDDQDSSHRFVAGFFGGEIQILPLPPQHADGDSKLPPSGYVRSSVVAPDQHFVLHPIQKQQQSPRQTHRRTSSNAVSDASPSRTVLLHRADSLSSKGEDSHSNPIAPPPSLRSTPPLPPSNKPPQQNAVQQFFKHFPNPGGKRCGSCEEYENRLHVMASDMEYLRAAALQNEYVCQLCQNEESSIHSKESPRLAEASSRLAEIEKQHLEQIEDMTQQWSLWQIEMYSKLSKFASIAKDLKEQSNLRLSDGIKVNEELRAVAAERDALAIEVDRLSASLVHRDVERVEYQKLKEIVVKYESQGLERARQMIAQRDKAIRDLTSRLENVVGTMEMERRKQAQRRQIIFPKRGSLPAPQTSALFPHCNNEFTEGSRDELEIAKEQIRLTEIILENSQAAAARSEAAYGARIAELEERLSAAES